jgi:cyclophilin family peptidyl-prolyl cis-trans isomerase
MPQPAMVERTAIAEGLVALEADAAVARLTQLFNDTLAIVRATALESLCEVDSATTPEYLKKALADGDPAVVVTAVDIAARRKLTALIGDIVTLYLDHRDIIDADIKRTIVNSWTTFEADSTYDSMIISMLEEACNDEWQVIRREAAKLIKEMYGLDRRNKVFIARSQIEKRNFRKLFQKYEINPRAILQTSRGTITLELLYGSAPKTVNNFVSLAEDGFYDNRIFHRVIAAFVIQDGAPRPDGWGDPGYAIRSEFNREAYATGTLGMAHAGKDTGGSQYFITLAPQPHLEGRYTVFGRVIDGMDVAHEIVRGDNIETIRIEYPKGDV